MACNITTGLTLGASVTPQGTCLVSSPGKVVLFSPTTLSGTDRSVAFTIPAGMGVLIDAYNMVPGYHIYLNRLVVTSECLTAGNACNPEDYSKAGSSQPVVVFRERMTLGNNPDRWSLYKQPDESKGNSRCQLLITVPGTYELELEDVSVQLGDMEVEYKSFKLADVGHLPDVYYGGVI